MQTDSSSPRLVEDVKLAFVTSPFERSKAFQLFFRGHFQCHPLKEHGPTDSLCWLCPVYTVKTLPYVSHYPSNNALCFKYCQRHHFLCEHCSSHLKSSLVGGTVLEGCGRFFFFGGWFSLEEGNHSPALASRGLFTDLHYNAISYLTSCSFSFLDTQIPS